jgi:ketosteroid isomerase-like protein
MDRLISSLVIAWMVVIPCAVQADEGDRDLSSQRTVAEAEIAKLPITYGWAVDAKDIDLLMTVFSQDIVYDLSAYGFPNAVGWQQVRDLFSSAIFPFVECSFISISNIRSHVTGNTATGADYFVHAGYNPVTQPPNTRSHTEGQHFYEFKKEGSKWKISYMRGNPFYERWEPFDPDGLRYCQ